MKQGNIFWPSPRRTGITARSFTGAYIAPYLDFDHNPAFLADECALNQCYNFKRTGNIEHTFRDIPQMYEEGAARGVRHMFLASWNRTGFDSVLPGILSGHGAGKRDGIPARAGIRAGARRVFHAVHQRADF